MNKFTAFTLLLLSESLWASACHKTEWSNELLEFLVIEICDTDNCDNYSKWDLLYFSAKIFGYNDIQNFYDIKTPEYQARHCLIRVQGKRNGTHFTRSKGLHKVSENLNEIVLMNNSCPNVGDKVKGHIIFQERAQYEISTCSRIRYTGRVYLNVSKIL